MSDECKHISVLSFNIYNVVIYNHVTENQIEFNGMTFCSIKDKEFTLNLLLLLEDHYRAELKLR